jgi:glycosyltransferase involved in cell wall biosynthesis
VRMRVAIFSDTSLDQFSGLSTALKAVIGHAPAGWRTRVYTAADCHSATDTCFTAASISSALPWRRDARVYMPRMRQFARELRREGVDLIHITTPGPVGLAGRWLARQLNVPVVGSCHTHYGEQIEAVSGSPRLGNLMNDYVSWLYASSSVLLVPSRATRAMIEAQGFPSERLRVWPRGVDTTQFSPTRASADTRRRWQVDERRLAILCAGRLSPEKGMHLVAPIQRDLHRRGVAHRFIFAGDGPMQPQLQRDCPEGIFLGRIPMGQLAVVMASADVLLFPSAVESCGETVLEAQASGLPVLVSDKGGPREQVVANATGFVCQADKTSDFVDRIVGLRHPVQRRSMSVVARQFALGHGWPDALRPLFATWRQAIASHAPSMRPAAMLGDRATARWPALGQGRPATEM